MNARDKMKDDFQSPDHYRDGPGLFPLGLL